MGIMHLAAASKSSGSSPAFFLILIVLFILFYMLILRPNRNRQRRAAQQQNLVTPGQRIRTTAGLYGTVVSGDDRDIVVEIAPGVHVKMLRRAVMEVLPDDYGNTFAPEPEDDPADEPEFDHPFEHGDQANGGAPRDEVATGETDFEPEDQPNGNAPSDERKTKDRNA